MSAPGSTDSPAVVVTVTEPSPTPANPDANSGAETRERIAEISGRVEAIQTQITEGIEGERTWTSQQLQTLRQEVQNLAATLQTLSQGMPEQIQSLREELTRLSQSLVTAPVETPVVAIVDPVVESADATPEIVTAPDAPQNSQSQSPKRKNRVI